MNTKKVHKKILENGLTILVVSQKTIPKVSTQLWYNVGSRDELSGEKGIAHLIEHMIFKGTKTLSESDINMITQKLSGYCNAFTSHDYTGYMFDFPSQNWHEAFPIMADCMSNCVFNPEMLASELKAVIQELKMYNDDFGSSLVEKMLAALFYDHPYHHPIIGYKQDLWNLKQETLVNFYKKHYIPNNATLIVVGDVEPEDVFERAQTYFGDIKGNPDYKKADFYHMSDIARQHIQLYRDIKIPIYLSGWVIPGLKKAEDYIADIFSWILASGMGSRLYTKLVNKLELATDIDGFVYDLSDHGVFFISIEPAQDVTQEELNKHVIEEIKLIAEHGLLPEEIVRATRKVEMDYLTLLESTQKQAYSLGKYYTALQDENYLYRYTQYPKDKIQEQIKKFAADFLREAVMCTGSVVSLPKEEQKYWKAQQELSDKEDARILEQKVRGLAVEPGRTVHTIEAHAPKSFDFPEYSEALLSNGIKVLYYHNPDMPKIELILDFKAKYMHDPVGKEGLLNFLADMMLEGTKKYNADELAKVIESYGMSFTVAPGRILMTMLSEDVSVGLDLLYEIVTESIFDPIGVNKVRNQLATEVTDFWDTPAQFGSQLARQNIYKSHAYSRHILGSHESLAAITRDDLVDAYKKYVTPQEAVLVVVGNLKDFNLIDLLNKKLGLWQGPAVPDLVYPSLAPVSAATIDYPMNRDQIVLTFCGLSVERTHPDYDKLLLFDQVFTGGILGSMNSRLFALREQSGLFYTIGGSLLSNSDRQPGMIFIKTIVSPDRLKEAEKSIEHIINTAIDTLEPEEFTQAKQALINSLVDNFATNKHMAVAFLFLNIFKFGKNYFDTRARELEAVTKEEVQAAVRKYLKSDALIKIRIGRI